MSEWIEQLITKNKYSRPGLKNTGIKGLVMHWTATPGASDENEVKFFDGADGGGGRYASAHIFVDRDSARLDIPLDEVAYHANDHACRVAQLKPNANFTSIGIEMCVEKDGTIHPETVSRAAKVAAVLCKQFNLNPLSDIFRHFDVTGKNCPAPWVSNQALFAQFKNEVAKSINSDPTPTTKPDPYFFASTTGPVAKVIVIGENVGIHNAPDYNADLVRKAIKGEIFDVYANINDWHAVGGTNWIKGENGKNLSLDLDALKRPVTKPAFIGLLKQGSKNEQVKLVQQVVGVTADGDFGSKTKAAVMTWQKAHGLTADGVVGPKTWSVMF